ncbi:tyrosine-type recombinase/integrase [Roseiconus lacunae]|uniref:tyrosine-type recombinase/integrase n=1 Tax=Roseiconus lacunae TaxID=2605694 RepID=UPI003F52DA05
MKVIPIVGEARNVLAPYLLRGDDELCFRNRRGTAWNKDTFRRHVTRKCDDNKIKRWTPYQIRHLVGQIVRDKTSAEHTQAILGHSRISMVETCSRIAEARAVEAAQAIAEAS